MKKLKNLYKISELIIKEMNGLLSGNEKDMLHKWLKNNPDSIELYKKLQDKQFLSHRIESYSNYNSIKAWQNVEHRISEKVITKRLKPAEYLKIAAAILIPLLIASSIFIYKKTSYNNKITEASFIQDIKPGCKKAELTLSTGKKIVLNSNQSKIKIKDEAGTKIINTNIFLLYSLDESKDKNQKVVYNSIKTPKGGEYSIKLSDGTKVWLNAATTLIYPVAFRDSIRNVSLEGEAYFEVAENKEKPFVVTTENIDIIVLGTSFNISSYNDDDMFATTLVEGKVKINTNNNKYNLKPGQHFSLIKSSSETNIKEVNTELYTTWKDGNFIFENETLESILKQFSRWYNFTSYFKYEELKLYEFSGNLSRYKSPQKLFDMIEQISDVRFEIIGNELRISKYTSKN